ncbi:hypothetical protein EDB83DRAFT_2316347 [Lactarius deliciosus]|nr:hypothetical protein EDB83DRAFT_2316347 [Lactarius deliciosus]
MPPLAPLGGRLPCLPSPFLGHGTPYAWEGGRCPRRSQHSPPPFPAAPPYTRGKGARKGMRRQTPPFPSRGRGAHEGHAAPAPPYRTTLYTQERGAEGHVTPNPALPFPFARRGRTDGHLPAAPPCTHGSGARKGTQPSTLPFPFAQKGRTQGARHPWHLHFDRALYTQERGAEGHATPGPTLPIRVEGACTGDTTPLPLGRAAPYVQTGGKQGQAGASHPILWRPICVARGARGLPPPYVSRSRASAISMCLRSLHPHPVFAHCSTT